MKKGRVFKRGLFCLMIGWVQLSF